jgi:hypothetical protein
MVLSVANLFIVKTIVVLGARVPQSVVIRVIGLDQNPARTITTPGATGNLRYELKGSFGRSEVWQGQTGINGNDTN